MEAGIEISLVCHPKDAPLAYRSLKTTKVLTLMIAPH